jgi:hypothetical protein
MMSFRLLGMWMRMWMRGLMFSCAVGVGLIGLPAAGVVLGQVDDFQDGTFQNWQGGSSPFNVSTGGPDGSGDRYLRISTSGGNLGTNNVTQWTGDYIAEDILSLNFHLNNLGANPVSMRLVLFGQNGTFASTAVVLPAASGWVSVEFLLDDTEFTQTQGFATFDQVLATVQTVLLRHDPDPLDPPMSPTPVTGTLGIDNVTALPEPRMVPMLATGIVALYRLRARRRSGSAAAG